MASNPTKILQYDLDVTLQNVFKDLKAIQGTYSTLKERLLNINSDLFDANTKLVINDLINGYQASGQLTVERIESLKYEIKAAIMGAGNYSESFTYDASGNVVKHVVTGDSEYTVEYNYVSATTGELSYSLQKFKNLKGQLVAVRKDYTYTNGDITSIATATTVDTTPPAEVSGLTASSGSAGSATLSWTNPLDPDFSYVNIYNGTTKINTVKIASGPFTMSGLVSGQSYTFTVKTVDTSNNESTGATATVIVM